MSRWFRFLLSLLQLANLLVATFFFATGDIAKASFAMLIALYIRVELLSDEMEDL